MFSKRRSIKSQLANLKFSKIRDGPKFLFFGGGLVIGGKDYTHIFLIFIYYRAILIYIVSCTTSYNTTVAIEVYSYIAYNWFAGDY